MTGRKGSSDGAMVKHRKRRQRNVSIHKPVIQIEQVLVPRTIANTTMRITQIFFFI